MENEKDGIVLEIPTLHHKNMVWKIGKMEGNMESKHIGMKMEN